MFWSCLDLLQANIDNNLYNLKFNIICTGSLHKECAILIVVMQCCLEYCILCLFHDEVATTFCACRFVKNFITGLEARYEVWNQHKQFAWVSDRHKTVRGNTTHKLHNNMMLTGNWNWLHLPHFCCIKWAINSGVVQQTIVGHVHIHTCTYLTGTYVPLHHLQSMCTSPTATSCFIIIIINCWLTTVPAVETILEFYTLKLTLYVVQWPSVW